MREIIRKIRKKILVFSKQYPISDFDTRSCDMVVFIVEKLIRILIAFRTKNVKGS